MPPGFINFLFFPRRRHPCHGGGLPRCFPAARPGNLRAKTDVGPRRAGLTWSSSLGPTETGSAATLGPNVAPPCCPRWATPPSRRLFLACSSGPALAPFETTPGSFLLQRTRARPDHEPLCAKAFHKGRRIQEPGGPPPRKGRAPARKGALPNGRKYNPRGGPRRQHRGTPNDPDWPRPPRRGFLRRFALSPLRAGSRKFPRPSPSLSFSEFRHPPIFSLSPFAVTLRASSTPPTNQQRPWSRARPTPVRGKNPDGGRQWAGSTT